MMYLASAEWAGEKLLTVYVLCRYRLLHILYIAYCDTVQVYINPLWTISDPYLPFGELYSTAWGETMKLCWPIGITPSHQPANMNYTLAPTLCWAWAGEYYPPLPCLTGGANRQKEEKTVLDRPLQKADVDVPRCPWNLVILAFQAYQTRNGCVRGQLVQHDRAAIVVYLREATRPAIKSSVWAGPVTARSRFAVWSYSEGDLWIGGS